MTDLFANLNPFHLLYLAYGASFLFLGISIATKDMKGSDFKLGNILWLLAAFGFLHGAHEWVHLGTWVERINLSTRQLLVAEAVSTLLLTLSFMFLLQFSYALSRVLDERRMRWIWAAPVCFFFLWLYHFAKQENPADFQFLRIASAGARYTLGFVGGIFTSYGLIAYAGVIKATSQAVAQKLRYAGFSFIFYALFEGLFLSGYKMPFLAVPVEVLRTAAAISIAYFISKALNVFDIEARSRMEEQTRLLIQAEKLSSLGQLAAGIAHEINNPLAKASLGVQTLKDKLQNHEADGLLVERLNAVEANIDRASVIAQELLHFSRKSGEEFLTLDINDVILNALTLLQFKLHRINLTQELASLPEIMGNPLKLEHVFINVLSNALEAMPEGGNLSIVSRQKEGMVEVCITDTGSGVAAENQARVFEPFFTTKEVGAGTGLGLFVSYSIIRQHRGVIELASKPGAGTTVTVKIPVREGHVKM